VASATQKADEKKADAAAELMVTEAQGRHDVAVQRCKGLAGDQQKECKDQAEAALELAKARAKAEKAEVMAGNGP
jgi:hypothetical protein